MKKLHKGSLLIPTDGMVLNIVIMSGCIIFGVVLGAFYVRLFDGDFLSVSNELKNIAENGIGNYNIKNVFFNICKYHIAVFVFGFTFLGIVCTPVVVCMKGFFVSLSVSSILKVFGGTGITYALAVFGVQTFFTVASFLFLSAFSFEISKRYAVWFFAKSGQTPIRKTFPVSYLVTFGIVFVFILLVALLDVCVTPSLVVASSQNIMS